MPSRAADYPPCDAPNGATATSSPPAAASGKSHADGEEEDQTAGDPNDEAAEVLVGVRGEIGQNARRGGVVRVQHAPRHGDEDRDDDHGQADHKIEHLHRIGSARQFRRGRKHGPPQMTAATMIMRLLDDVHTVMIHGQIVEGRQMPGDSTRLKQAKAPDGRSAGVRAPARGMGGGRARA